jgi:hypothetical protein
VDLDQTVVILTVETRGADHIHDLESALARAGHAFERL